MADAALRIRFGDDGVVAFGRFGGQYVALRMRFAALRIRFAW